MSEPADPTAEPADAGLGRVLAWGGATAVVVAVLAATHRLGGDMPGVFLRVEAFRQGHYVRLPQWFGGVPNLTYSILLAPLGALLGVTVLAALSAGSTVAGVTHLARSASPLRRRVASSAAVASAVATVCVGRITYSTGTAFAVWALVLLSRRSRPRTTAAVVLAALAGASSPVSGLFLAMIAVAHLLPARRVVAALSIGTAALAPVTVVNLLFSTHGGLDLGWTSGLTIMTVYGAFLLGSRSRTVRATAALGIAATLGVTVVDTQITYIIGRLPETFGGATAAATGRRVIAPLLVTVFVGWNLLSIRTGMSESGHAERSGAAFASLDAALDDLDPRGAVEVVPTALHWETWYIARHHPIARGWERQADIDHGPLFYSDAPLTAAAYADWLRAQEVEYVALGDLEIDHAGRAEAALLADPPPYLVEVFHDAGWTIWQVELP